MVIVEIKESSKQAKAIIVTLKAFDFVKFIDKEKPEQKSPYHPEFVEKVLNSYKNDKRTKIKSEKLWESI